MLCRLQMEYLVFWGLELLNNHKQKLKVYLPFIALRNGQTYENRQRLSFQALKKTIRDIYDTYKERIVPLWLS